jgi:hypothetical protein
MGIEGNAKRATTKRGTEHGEVKDVPVDSVLVLFVAVELVTSSLELGSECFTLLSGTNPVLESA